MAENLKEKAAKILGFPVENMSYLWSNKCHLGGWKEDNTGGLFDTLCGAGDKSGFWGFASEDNFDGTDGCKNCRRVLNKQGG